MANLIKKLIALTVIAGCIALTSCATGSGGTTGTSAGGPIGKTWSGEVYHDNTGGSIGNEDR